MLIYKNQLLSCVLAMNKWNLKLKRMMICDLVRFFSSYPMFKNNIIHNINKSMVVVTIDVQCFLRNTHIFVMKMLNQLGIEINELNLMIKD